MSQFDGCREFSDLDAEHVDVLLQIKAEFEAIRRADQVRHVNYQAMFDHLYDQMVTCLTQDIFRTDGIKALHCWSVLMPDGTFETFDGLTQEEVEAAWRELWGLDRI